MNKRALILGIGGQDGSYLAEILLEKGYEVHGLYRRSSVDNLWRIRHLLDRIELHQGDICDQSCITNLIDTIVPDEVYNEADQDSVGWSRSAACAQVDVTVKAVVGILEALHYMGGGVKFFQPVSATMFGSSPPPQTELTSLQPETPYACAKASAWMFCQHYRREYGMHISCGILFNHDSPRRGADYLLQRIIRGEKLWGDLQTIVDIGYAPEYMEAAYRMLQQPYGDDYVIGTGKGYTIADLVRWYEENGPKRVPSDVPLAEPKPTVTAQDVTQGTRALIAQPWKAKIKLDFHPRHDALSVLKLLKSQCQIELPNVNILI